METCGRFRKHRDKTGMPPSSPCRRCKKGRPTCEQIAYRSICENCWVDVHFSVKKRDIYEDDRSAYEARLRKRILQEATR